jgi:hypothetical protein
MGRKQYALRTSKAPPTRTSLRGRSRSISETWSSIQ